MQPSSNCRIFHNSLVISDILSRDMQQLKVGSIWIAENRTIHNDDNHLGCFLQHLQFCIQNHDLLSSVIHICAVCYQAV